MRTTNIFHRFHFYCLTLITEIHIVYWLIFFQDFYVSHPSSITLTQWKSLKSE